MSSKPRIVVVKMREIVYTVILLCLVILLVVCLVLMFSGKTKGGSSISERYDTSLSEETGDDAAESQSASSGTALYCPGVYTASVTLGDSAVDVEVTVDSSHINSIRLVNLSEAMAASFPLVSPSLEHIASQVLYTQSLEEITCPQENRYTSQLLLSAISDALARARAAK